MAWRFEGPESVLVQASFVYKACLGWLCRYSCQTDAHCILERTMVWRSEESKSGAILSEYGASRYPQYSLVSDVSIEPALFLEMRSEFCLSCLLS